MIKEVPASFTLDELLVYLREEREEVAAGYRTSREWAAHFGIHPDVMRVILYQAKVAGVLLCQRDSRERIDGVRTKVPVYAFDVAQGEGETGDAD